MILEEALPRCKESTCFSEGDLVGPFQASSPRSRDPLKEQPLPSFPQGPSGSPHDPNYCGHPAEAALTPIFEKVLLGGTPKPGLHESPVGSTLDPHPSWESSWGTL